MRGTISFMLSSIAISMSSRRRTAPCSDRPMCSTWEIVESSSLVISRASSNSPPSSSGCTFSQTAWFLLVTIPSVTKRSTAIAVPTAKTISIGYMNMPPVEKKLTIE